MHGWPASQFTIFALLLYKCSKIILDFANIPLGICSVFVCVCVCLFVFAMCIRFIHNPTRLLYDTAVLTFFLLL